MAANWRESIPRKMRRVKNDKGTQYLISIPESIAVEYEEDALFRASRNFVGQIVLTQVEGNSTEEIESDITG